MLQRLCGRAHICFSAVQLEKMHLDFRMKFSVSVYSICCLHENILIRPQ